MVRLGSVVDVVYSGTKSQQFDFLLNRKKTQLYQYFYLSEGSSFMQFHQNGASCNKIYGPVNTAKISAYNIFSLLFYSLTSHLCISMFSAQMAQLRLLLHQFFQCYFRSTKVYPRGEKKPFGLCCLQESNPGRLRSKRELYPLRHGLSGNQYKMDYIKREWPLYKGRGSTAPPNSSHCGGEDTRDIREGFELRTFLHCNQFS